MYKGRDEDFEKSGKCGALRAKKERKVKAQERKAKMQEKKAKAQGIAKAIKSGSKPNGKWCMTHSRTKRSNSVPDRQHRRRRLKRI